MFTKKNMIVIALIAIFVMGANAQVGQVVATMSWEDGYQNIYLPTGIYHFEMRANITTDVPFDETNTWMDSAEIVNVFSYAEYNSAPYAYVAINVYDETGSITIENNGTYSIRAGTYATYACTVNSNEATLIRDAYIKDDTIPGSQ